MQRIQSIIFDLGGVILNIDYNATVEAFRKLGIPDFEKQFSQLRQNAFFDDWETGKISPEEWLSGVRNATGQEISEEKIIAAWNAMLLDFPMSRLRLLQQLRNRYNLFLLSNTNAIHEYAFNEMLRAQCGIPSLAALFDKVYYSHQIGLRKPHPEPFQLILNENGLEPEQTLFIDDSPQHIKTAKSLGLQTIHLIPPQTIETIFKPVNHMASK